MWVGQQKEEGLWRQNRVSCTHCLCYLWATVNLHICCPRLKISSFKIIVRLRARVWSHVAQKAPPVFLWCFSRNSSFHFILHSRGSALSHKGCSSVPHCIFLSPSVTAKPDLPPSPIPLSGPHVTSRSSGFTNDWDPDNEGEGTFLYPQIPCVYTSYPLAQWSSWAWESTWVDLILSLHFFILSKSPSSSCEMIKEIF